MSGETFRDSPELVFGIAGAIGIDVDEIVASLNSALSGVGYSSESIKLTDEMGAYSPTTSAPASADYDAKMNYKMDVGNELCVRFADKATLARIGVRAIRNRRRSRTGDFETPLNATAFVVRQLKRPEEVDLFRRVYGPRFFLISAYGGEAARRDRLERQLKRSVSTRKSSADIACIAERLMERDSVEAREPFGQNLQETFPMADVFIDGVNKVEMDRTLTRFTEALFGRTDISPSKAEYGMYAAKSAGLRSADLSRQVGAAIFSDDGELITQGCNEAPKAFGGTYWDLEEPDHRDVKLGYDPNEIYKKEIVRDLVERFIDDGLLSAKATEIGGPADIVDAITAKAKAPGSKDGALVGAAILDLTEYGRIVHAEMCAICDAARLGRSIKGATLFCTVFPCHNCTKHVLASGIKKVVYIEPYPKSKAKELHENEIEIESEVAGRVSYMPFLGISPQRYRDIFQKKKRKGSDGKANTWYEGKPRPLINAAAPSYFDVEALAISNTLLGTLKDTDPEAGSAAAPEIAEDAEPADKT